MKKRLLFGLSFFAVLGVNAQQNINFQSALIDRNESFVKQKVDGTILPKAEGDTVWSNDFTTPAEWVMATGAGHTAGPWTIVNSLPTALTSQSASYGNFPTAMLSTSGGNFAFINSDAAGGAGVQNATISLVSGVDLSSYGSTGFYLRFKEIFRHYYDQNFVDVSNDGGLTWTSFPVNTVPEVPVNSNSGNPSIETVNITSANGGAWGTDVRIRFRYQGAWDWFWAVDDVQIIEAYANDLKVTAFSTATDTSSTLGVDYHMVPVSQTSFPGVTFQAFVLNNGTATQSTAALNATSGAYNQTGPTRVIAPAAFDSVQVVTPFMIPATIGNSIVDLKTTLGVPDSDPTNNQKSVTFRRDANLYSRDDGNVSGSISNVTSNPDLPLKIGNLMEIFDPMDVYSVSVRLMNQTAAVGQQIYAEIHKYNDVSGEFEYSTNTADYTILNSDLSQFVKLQLPFAMNYAAGDLLWVMVGHYGGATEVSFGMAQDTWEGSVRGITNDGSTFSLSSPSAIMVRLSDKNELGVEEIADALGMNVFPNPATDVTNVRFTAQNQTDVVINVTDMAGKVVLANTLTNVIGKQTVELNTSELNAGVYVVNVITDGAKSTKKLTIK